MGNEKINKEVIQGLSDTLIKLGIIEPFFKETGDHSKMIISFNYPTMMWQMKLQELMNER